MCSEVHALLSLLFILSLYFKVTKSLLFVLKGIPLKLILLALNEIYGRAFLDNAFWSPSNLILNYYIGFISIQSKYMYHAHY